MSGGTHDAAGDAPEGPGTDWSDRAAVHARLHPLAPAERVATLQPALAARHDDRFLHGLLGIALYNLGELDRSRMHLKLGLEGAAGDGDLLFHVGLADRSEGRLASALEWFERSVATRPNADYWALALQTLEELDRWPEVVSRAERALEDFPHDPRLAIVLVQAVERLDGAERAVDELDRRDDGATPALAELRYRLLAGAGRAEAAGRAHREALGRHLRGRADYRERATRTLDRVPVGRSRDALVALWTSELARVEAPAEPVAGPAVAETAAHAAARRAAHPRLAMSLLVRDEIDVVEANVRFHAARGVEHFVVTDNGSVDGTREALEALAREVSMQIIDEPSHTIDQDLWVTRMARRLIDAGTFDWAIHNDADEFWVPDEGSLPETIGRAVGGRDVGVLACARRNMLVDRAAIARADYRFADNVHRVERTVPLLPGEVPWNDASDSNGVAREVMDKVLTRLDGLASVGYGNHDAVHAGTTEPLAELTVLHYPVRTYAQFERKVVNYGRSLERNDRFDPGSSLHLRHWYERWRAGALHEVYSHATFEPERLRRLLAEGFVSIDTRVAEGLDAPGRPDAAPEAA